MRIEIIVAIAIAFILTLMNSLGVKAGPLPLMASPMLSKSGEVKVGTSGSGKSLNRSKAKSESSTTVKPVVAPEFMKEACKSAKTKLEYCKKIQK